MDSEEESTDMTESEEEYVFYHEIGVALSQWAAVEQSVERIAMGCAHCQQDSVLIGLGFHAIENFRSKLAYTTALLEYRRRNERIALQRWAKLNERISTNAKRRNEIAHFQAAQVGNAKPGKRFALHEAGWMVKWSDISLAVRDIAERSRQFTALSYSLANFAASLAGEPEQLPEVSEQQLRRPTIRSIEARMRAALGRQPRPSGSLPEQKRGHS